VARYLRLLTILFLLLMPLAAMVSQNRSQSVEDPTATPTASETPDPNILLTSTATPTSTIDPENTPEPTPFPTATPEIPAEVFVLLDVRTDMERLADENFGVGSRPAGWNGVISPFEPQIALLTRADLELLATTLINPTARPAAWIGAFASTPFAVARDVRHDLEQLADYVYGRDARPDGWLGGDPLMRCNRATQALVALLQRGGIYRLEVQANAPNFCREVELSVTRFTETELLANAGNLFSNQVSLLAEHEITTDFAVAFLDPGAVGRVGRIPRGTPIQVLGRSTTAFSNMMLVQGDSFIVFVEYTNTTVSEAQFRGLNNWEGLQLSTGCFADWCGTN
jgi:hypothetical protein